MCLLCRSVVCAMLLLADVRVCVVACVCECLFVDMFNCLCVCVFVGLFVCVCLCACLNVLLCVRFSCSLFVCVTAMLFVYGWVVVCLFC